jgi:hypothetical protein
MNFVTHINLCFIPPLVMGGTPKISDVARNKNALDGTKRKDKSPPHARYSHIKSLAKSSETGQIREPLFKSRFAAP